MTMKQDIPNSIRSVQIQSSISKGFVKKKIKFKSYMWALLRKNDPSLVGRGPLVPVGKENMSLKSNRD
jgi:hypothetical protein